MYASLSSFFSLPPPPPPPPFPQSEIRSCLEFMSYIYSIFGFDFDLKLSTRPEGFIGDQATWDMAEAQVRKSRLLRSINQSVNQSFKDWFYEC